MWQKSAQIFCAKKKPTVIIFWLALFPGVPRVQYLVLRTTATNRTSQNQTRAQKGSNGEIDLVSSSSMP